MRVSVRKDDPGYRSDAVLFEVTLDGQKLRGCFTADEELGKAWRYAEDENGVTIIDRNPDRLREECIEGVVRVIAPKPQ